MKINPVELTLIREGLSRLARAAVRHKDKKKEESIELLMDSLNQMEEQFYG